jgi:hypothetical protein
MTFTALLAHASGMPLKSFPGRVSRAIRLTARKSVLFVMCFGLRSHSFQYVHGVSMASSAGGHPLALPSMPSGIIYFIQASNPRSAHFSFSRDAETP